MLSNPVAEKNKSKKSEFDDFTLEPDKKQSDWVVGGSSMAIDEAATTVWDSQTDGDKQPQGAGPLPCIACADVKHTSQATVLYRDGYGPAA